MKKGCDEDDPLDALMTNVIMLKEQQHRGSKAEFNDFIDDDSFLGDRPADEETASAEDKESRDTEAAAAESPPQQLSITDSYLDKLSEVLAEELNLDEELETELAELTQPPPVSLANVLYDSESSSVEPIADPMETAGAADFVDETDASSFTEVESTSEIYSEIPAKVDETESASEIYSEITKVDDDGDDDNVEDLSYLAPQPGQADEMESDLPSLPPIESGIDNESSEE